MTGASRGKAKLLFIMNASGKKRTALTLPPLYVSLQKYQTLVCVQQEKGYRKTHCRIRYTDCIMECAI